MLNIIVLSLQFESGHARQLRSHVTAVVAPYGHDPRTGLSGTLCVQNDLREIREETHEAQRATSSEDRTRSRSRSVICRDSSPRGAVGWRSGSPSCSSSSSCSAAIRGGPGGPPRRPEPCWRTRWCWPMRRWCRHPLRRLPCRPRPCRMRRLVRRPSHPRLRPRSNSSSRRAPIRRSRQRCRRHCRS